MKFRTKINLLVFTAIFILSFVLLVWLSLFTINEALTHERFLLRRVAKQIERIATEHGYSNRAGIEQVNKELANGMKFVKDSKNINYKAVDFNGKVIVSHNYSGSYNFSTPPTGRRNYIFNWSSNCGQYWDFEFYYYGTEINIAIKARRHLELLETLWPFFLVAIIMLLTLSFIASRLITVKILKIMNKISTAAAAVANGDFSYRIAVSNTNDAVAQLEHDLNQTFSSLEISFNRVTEFSSEVAHELRTPLTVILGNLEVAVRRPRSSEEYQHIISEAIDDINRLHRLVDDMLLLLKPATAYTKDSFITLDMAEILNKVVEQLAFISELKDITLDASITPQLYVMGIESLLHRICFNLIHNAIKFSDNNSTVEIMLEAQNNNIVLKIIDHGAGIAPEAVDKVFTRFFKDSNSTGHGLGLPMAKQLVEVHGGTITLQSELGKGSSFIVKISSS
ncbi:MAG: HAMP domain-containing histidine kinase [Victivallaceae bacterium]|nr:HAMP domain-containing histidine kinase [Victivallaceae bacterium]